MRTMIAKGLRIWKLFDDSVRQNLTTFKVGFKGKVFVQEVHRPD